MKKKLIYIGSVFFLLCYLVFLHNRSQLILNKSELENIRNIFGSIKIIDSSDILILQNKVIDSIKHEFLYLGELNTDTLLKYKKGFCYDRSLLLQKICYFNNIKLRPVYIFYSNNNKTRWWNFFSPNVESHNIFEIYINNRWVVIMTNNKQNKFITLNEYLISGQSVPRNSLYVLHLNNRNMKFLHPSFIPDIY